MGSARCCLGSSSPRVAGPARGGHARRPDRPPTGLRGLVLLPGAGRGGVRADDAVVAAAGCRADRGAVVRGGGVGAAHLPGAGDAAPGRARARQPARLCCCPVPVWVPVWVGVLGWQPSSACSWCSCPSGWPARSSPGRYRSSSKPRPKPRWTSRPIRPQGCGCRLAAPAPPCCGCRGCSPSTHSAAALSSKASSPTGCGCGSAPRSSCSAWSSSPSACCKPARFWPRPGWPSGSGCCPPWSPPTCRPTCCWWRSRWPPTSRVPWGCCSAGSRCRRWTCRPARPTSSPWSTRPSGPPRWPPPTSPATWPGRSPPRSPGPPGSSAWGCPSCSPAPSKPPTTWPCGRGFAASSSPPNPPNPPSPTTTTTTTTTVRRLRPSRPVPVTVTAGGSGHDRVLADRAHPTCRTRTVRCLGPGQPDRPPTARHPVRAGAGPLRAPKPRQGPPTPTAPRSPRQRHRRGAGGGRGDRVGLPRRLRRLDQHPRPGPADRLPGPPERHLRADHPLRHHRRLPQPQRPARHLRHPRRRRRYPQGAAMKWVTRARPKTDRIACPWLMRRFIDPQTEILYVPAYQVLNTTTPTEAHSFFPHDAQSTHQGNRCTFEVLIDAFDLGEDPALVRLARIVHAADIASDLDSDPLGPGLLAIGEGGLAVEADDQRLLERGSFVYDALYAWCQTHPTYPPQRQPPDPDRSRPCSRSATSSSSPSWPAVPRR